MCRRQRYVPIINSSSLPGAAPRPLPAGRVTVVLAAAAGAALLSVPAGAATHSPARAAQHGARAATAAASCPWVSSSAPISQRVAQVMAQMTIPNEITMVEGQGTTNPYVFYMAGIPSLCIPSLGEEDGPNGVADGLTGVTELPAGVALAATFDPSLASQYGQVVGSEEVGKGAAVNLGPTINIDRDPRWGRSFETYTEDPYLNESLAVSEIDGLQRTGEMDQVKHYAVYNQETYRNTPQDDVIIDSRTLQEIYLPAFQAAVQQAKAASVMCSYAVINGDFACNNKFLETTMLRDAWNFPGFVTSDYGALHNVDGATDGTDQEQPFSDFFGATLQTAVENGTIPRSTLNTMVQRILTEMFRFNLIAKPLTGSTSATVTTPAHQAVGTDVAETGTTLLKNSGSVLPLPSSTAGRGRDRPGRVGRGDLRWRRQRGRAPVGHGQPAAGPAGRGRIRHPGQLHPGAAHRHLMAGHPGGEPVPRVCGDPVRRQLHRDADRTRDRHLRAGHHQRLWLLHAHLPDPERQADHRRPEHSPGAHVLGGGEPDRGPDLHARDLRGVVRADLGHAVRAGARADRGGGRGQVGQDRRGGGLGRHRVRGHRPAQPQPAVGAGRADRGGGGGQPAHGRGYQRGAPVAMPWLNQVAGVVDAWYPGQSSGTALASVLFGQTDPSGHLPVTFPASLAQVPASTTAQFPGDGTTVQYSEGLDVGYRWYNAKDIQPLFPFGYGLSYTSFRFSGLRVTRAIQGTQDVQVSATVTNTGRRSGADVAQLYVTLPASAGEPPRQLKGFQRVSLRPGQSSRVRFTLTPADLSWFDTSAPGASATGGGWSQSAGAYQVDVGDSVRAGQPAAARRVRGHVHARRPAGVGQRAGHRDGRETVHGQGDADRGREPDTARRADLAAVAAGLDGAAVVGLGGVRRGPAGAGPIGHVHGDAAVVRAQQRPGGTRHG